MASCAVVGFGGGPCVGQMRSTILARMGSSSITGCLAPFTLIPSELRLERMWRYNSQSTSRRPASSVRHHRAQFCPSAKVLLQRNTIPCTIVHVQRNVLSDSQLLDIALEASSPLRDHAKTELVGRRHESRYFRLELRREIKGLGQRRSVGIEHRVFNARQANIDS